MDGGAHGVSELGDVLDQLLAGLDRFGERLEYLNSGGGSCSIFWHSSTHRWYVPWAGYPPLLDVSRPSGEMEEPA